MFAKINHVAIISEKYALLASFYESLFGMKRSPKGKINRAITVGDGYVGLNINPRKPGRPGGLDHFGVEVEDVETARAAAVKVKGLAGMMAEAASERVLAAVKAARARANEIAKAARDAAKE